MLGLGYARSLVSLTCMMRYGSSGAVRTRVSAFLLIKKRFDCDLMVISRLCFTKCGPRGRVGVL